jgi:hypothetical protein
MYELQFSVPSYVHLLDLAEGIKIVLLLKGLANHVKNLDNFYEKIVWHVDTTYNIGKIL